MRVLSATIQPFWAVRVSSQRSLAPRRDQRSSQRRLRGPPCPLCRAARREGALPLLCWLPVLRATPGGHVCRASCGWSARAGVVLRLSASLCPPLPSSLSIPGFRELLSPVPTSLRGGRVQDDGSSWFSGVFIWMHIGGRSAGRSTDEAFHHNDNVGNRKLLESAKCCAHYPGGLAAGLGAVSCFTGVQQGTGLLCSNEETDTAS
ncbi:uncharacterized protein LOC133233792 [Bos javanicus]|uniref:uncharacterized protein LOC133233792 n=1 Tax=Bos javanicus TaxID=9906 RepID=UPI002AA67D0A|nr:uncharacterized protein LOC133233792 [Bos javanicus]